MGCGSSTATVSTVSTSSKVLSSNDVAANEYVSLLAEVKIDVDVSDPVSAAVTIGANIIILLVQLAECRYRKPFFFYGLNTTVQSSLSASQRRTGRYEEDV